MASNLVERLMSQVEPYISADVFTSTLILYSSDSVTASQIKTIFSLSTDSGTELDTLLATMPSITLLNLTLTNVANRTRWAAKIGATLDMQGILYNDAPSMRTALGI